MAEEQQSELDATVLSEQIVEKLKLFNYEKEICQQKGLKPLNIAFFSSPSDNPNDQFNYFKILIKWLFQLCDCQIEFDKFSDPMSIATTIQGQLQKLNVPCDFPAIKLKNSYGYTTCQVLNDLIDLAIKKKIKFKKPQYEKNQDDQPVQQKEEDNQSEPEEENISVGSEEIDIQENAGFQNEIDEDKQVIQSKTSVNDWLLEVERVSSKLKLQIKQDSKEWRSHIELTKQYSGKIQEILPGARKGLEGTTEQLSHVLDRISKNEKLINSNLTDLGAEYKIKADESKQIMTIYNSLNSSVKEMDDQHKQLQDKNREIKEQINILTENTTDSSPVVKIKEAIQKISGEIKAIDLRIGVLAHNILQYKLRSKRHNFNEDEEMLLDNIAEMGVM